MSLVALEGHGVRIHMLTVLTSLLPSVPCCLQACEGHVP